jgi:hypothetical protein
MRGDYPGFEKMVLTKRYPEIVIIVNTSNVLTANYLLLCKFALGR